MKYDEVISLVEFMTDNLSNTFQITGDTDSEE